MSDYIIKIIPTDSYLRYIPHAKIQKAIKILNTKTLPKDISAVIYETPVFVDCGVNLEEIKCNFCGKILDFDWWGEVMNKAAENSFRDLVVEMPCYCVFDIATRIAWCVNLYSSFAFVNFKIL